MGRADKGEIDMKFCKFCHSCEDQCSRIDVASDCWRMGPAEWESYHKMVDLLIKTQSGTIDSEKLAPSLDPWENVHLVLPRINKPWDIIC